MPWPAPPSAPRAPAWPAPQSSGRPRLDEATGECEADSVADGARPAAGECGLGVGEAGPLVAHVDGHPTASRGRGGDGHPPGPVVEGVGDEHVEDVAQSGRSSSTTTAASPSTTAPAVPAAPASSSPCPPTRDPSDKHRRRCSGAQRMTAWSAGSLRPFWGWMNRGEGRTRCDNNRWVVSSARLPTPPCADLPNSANPWEHDPNCRAWLWAGPPQRRAVERATSSPRLSSRTREPYVAPGLDSSELRRAMVRAGTQPDVGELSPARKRVLGRGGCCAG
jgi:hypothetical protein